MGYDVFISYAGQDIEYVSALVTGLKAKGLKVWYDRDILDGPEADFHGQRIELGLLDSRHALIVLSKHYISNMWPVVEFGALGQIEMRSSRKIIMPVLHGISTKDLQGRFSVFANEQKCVYSDRGSDFVVNEIIKRINELDRDSGYANVAVDGIGDYMSFSPLGKYSYYGDRCPKCGHAVIVGNHRVVCNTCDYDDLMEPY